VLFAIGNKLWRAASRIGPKNSAYVPKQPLYRGTSANNGKANGFFTGRFYGSNNLISGQERFQLQWKQTNIFYAESAPWGPLQDNGRPDVYARASWWAVRVFGRRGGGQWFLQTDQRGLPRVAGARGRHWAHSRAPSLSFRGQESERFGWPNSLRQCILNANASAGPGREFTFQSGLTGHDFTLTDGPNWRFSMAVTITGPGRPQKISVSGATTRRAFSISGRYLRFAQQGRHLRPDDHGRATQEAPKAGAISQLREPDR